MAEHFAEEVQGHRILTRNASMELRFDPGAGSAHVIVRAVVQDPDFIELIDDPEPGVATRQIQLASVRITVESPSGAEVLSRVVQLPQPNADSAPVGFRLEAPVEAGRWRCTIRNHGHCEISCNAKLTFTPKLHGLVPTKIPIRVFGWLNFLRHAGSKVIGWAKAITAAAGAVAAVLGIVFLLLPALRPAQPCEGLDGVLSDLQVSPSVTYGGYLKRVRASTAGVDPKHLHQLGKMLRFRVHVGGAYKGKPLPIRWTTLSAVGEPVPEAELNNQLAMVLTPEACTDKGVERVWAPTPTRSGKFEIELTLYDDKGGELSSVRTDTFRGLG